MYLDLADQRGGWSIVDKNQQLVLDKNGRELYFDYTEYDLVESEKGDPRFRVISDKKEWKKGTIIRINENLEIVEAKEDKKKPKKLF